ncbi:MAG: undecaprenyl/decaprenyl-phosphate alpha-N-acetylglucosaminyl 1-phosphate transferase [Mollicutes bacterium]|nr:undecaprenyl/decaprenyl-phosphate alpha-N-acetylglucosaminyl 1-phosphate transferase [Mollicutes bacterium]
MDLVVNGHNIIEILIVTYLISFSSVFLTKKIAIHINAVDIPTERKVHTSNIARLGGVAIYISFLFGYMFYGEISVQMLSILIASFILIMLGIFDDIKPIKAKYKFLVHIITSSIVVFYGNLYFDEITLLGYTFYFPKLLNQIVSVLFITSAVNAINLIDGIDGLCAGISSIYFATIAIIAFILNRIGGLDIILCIIMLGATVGFLTHNFPPAKVFLGDNGSTFLGFMIAVIALLGFKVATIQSLAIPLLILAIPIFDTASAILRRILQRKKIGDPDKEHFHHQLLNMKFSVRNTVLIIYLINIAFSVVSIFYVIGNNKVAMIIYIAMMLVLLYIVLRTNILFNHKKKDKKK